MVAVAIVSQVKAAVCIDCCSLTRGMVLLMKNHVAGYLDLIYICFECF